MIQRGLECGITIFGTGDHNHNMTAVSFREQMAETEEVRARHPDLIILNNSEMTFLIGHFHVFEPGPITGSIAEAYGFLYDNHDRLTMANHPGLPTDEWNRRIIPTISAIEVVNGSVLSEARRQGRRLESILDVPSVGTYVRYLRLGIPVAALGNSDGHSLEELGTGFTGFHLKGNADREAVLEAIRTRATFATTSTAIDLRWRLEAGRLSWAVVVATDSGLSGTESAVELYNCDTLVKRVEMGSVGESGELRLERPGLYWIAVVSREHFAVSSPVEFEMDGFQVADEDRLHAEEARALAEREADAVAVSAEQVVAERELVLESPARIVLYTGEDFPELRDSSGKRLEMQLSHRGPVRPIIEKECEPWRFGEFYVWLDRNQVHEYRFTDITYRLDGSTFFFSASLLPYRLDKRERADELFRDQVSAIKGLVERSERCRISVVVPATFEAELQPSVLRLPVSVSDSIGGVSSRIALLPRSSGDGVELEQFFLESGR